MKKSLLLFSLLLLVVSAEARQNWWEGLIVLKSGEVRVGQVRYHAKWGAVMFMQDSTVETLPASRLALFRFFDSELNVWRKFRTYSEKERGFDRPIFYEVVISGAYTLLRKQKVNGHYDPSAVADSKRERMLQEQAKDYDYFFQYNDTVVPLTRFRQVMKATDAYEDLDKFVDSRRLSWHTKHDIVMMINRLNCQADEGCIPGLGRDRMAYSNE